MPNRTSNRTRALSNNASTPRRVAIIVGVMVAMGVGSGTMAKAEDGLKTFAHAYHGMLIDDQNREILASPKMIKQTQMHYLETLLEESSKSTRHAAEVFRAKVIDGELELVASDRAYLRYALIEALAGALKSEQAKLIRQRNRVLRGTIEIAFPQKTTFYRTRKHVVPEEVITVVSKMHADSSSLGLLLEPIIRALIEVLQYLAGLPDYSRDCLAEGVPLPPDWGSPDWQLIGTIADEFISEALTGQIWAYESTSYPRGTCLALPRIDENDIALLFGVICLGTETDKACFWDNERANDIRIPHGINDTFSFQEFDGGSALAGLNGGICTDCHAGQNPFVVHPESPAFDLANFQTTVDWYEPVGMNPGWPQNPGPSNLLDGVDTSYNPWFAAAQDGQSCITCHRLPEVDQLPDYCQFVLKRSAQRTMPSAGDPAGWTWPNNSEFRKHIGALRSACP